MRPSHRLASILAAVTAAAGLGLATPAGAALPTGGIVKVSPDGRSFQPVVDDAGSTVAYIQGTAGHVMVGSNRIVGDAGAKEIAISGDGSIVAFSTDKALAGGDANGARDVYAVNRDGGGLRLVSTAQAGFGSFSPTVNGNGAVIAYSGGVLDGGQRRIFVRDGGNAPAEVTAPEPCDCVRPSISNDGNLVAFEISDAGVYVWNRGGGVEKIEGRGATSPSTSGSGRAVAYVFQGTVNVFYLDNKAIETAPERGTNPSLSADGNVVAFQASDPLANDVNGAYDIVAYEVNTGLLSIVSTRPGGATGTNGSYQPSISGDGGRVAFESDSEDLTADGNNLRDIFLRVPGDSSGVPGGGVVDTDPDIPGAYWLVASDGGVFSFAGLGRQADFYGSTGDIALNQPIVGASPHPSGRGYWFVAADGGIFSFGDAGFFGSTGAIRLNQPIVGMAATPSGNGYWLVARDGGIFTFGDAEFHGSTGAIRLNQPIVGMASTPSGQGYWLVASDGGIFTFGDAAFMGSMGDVKLNKPIVGMAARPQGDGYWLVASDGGIFTFGQAPFKGSTGAVALNQPIVGMAATSTGIGYWFVASDGGVFTFGDAGFFGSTGDIKLNQPIVGIAGHS